MVDYKRKRGDTYAIPRTHKSKRTGLPIDITGYAFKMTVDTLKEPADALTNVFAMTGTITDADAGKYQFSPSTADATNVGDYFYDIQITDDGGLIESPEQGRYRVTQDITK